MVVETKRQTTRGYRNVSMIEMICYGMTRTLIDPVV
jgi:hypothetical protein